MPEPDAARAKLAQALGLALAAQVLVGKVGEGLENAELRQLLRALHAEASEAQVRCLDLAASYGDELHDEILHLAHQFADKAGETARAWIRPATGTLERFEVLAMAEAAEVVTWRSLALLAGGERELVDLVTWGLPVQERHLEDALAACRLLARRRAGAVA